RCIAPMERLMDRGRLKIMDLLGDTSVLEVPEADLRDLDPQLRFIMNLNTPEDVRRAEETAAERDTEEFPKT
ncbi:MAG: hypothetical protein V2B18_00505, partial [Pseudomonadota bacterium]